MSEDRKRYIHCPTCGRETLWSQENPWRPFCSERCRLIDLSAWATETHRIPGEEVKPSPSSEE
ncbi:DNA gyrase inhibitor YacG [Nitrosococcus wardiae]|uniref:DNA gyrase inhibitor YacG n=1 Tax=Nitrosococcus wardiae TaxID=1814290 RepID=A0A4P7BZP0_9GAMM|nr:DNA gyrase inhibitor YacG [Nitrosococcus wardiae]QBQ53906.1 DNA gyrase inhibitor YacG [Nitrosococcus wardiae]